MSTLYWLRMFLVGLIVMCLLAPSAILAQPFTVYGPEGSIGFRNPDGSYTYTYPGRLNPGANYAQPGTITHMPWGTVWMGADERMHGNVTDPYTGDHIRFAPQNR